MVLALDWRWFCLIRSVWILPENGFLDSSVDGLVKMSLLPRRIEANLYRQFVVVVIQHSPLVSFQSINPARPDVTLCRLSVDRLRCFCACELLLWREDPGDPIRQRTMEAHYVKIIMTDDDFLPG